MSRKVPLLFFLILSVVGFVQMVGHEHGTGSACERTSQLQLQFAWSAEQTEAVLACWGAAGAAGVVAGIYADFFFIAGYGPLLAMLVHRACLWLARVESESRWLLIGRYLMWGQLLAGLLDAIENVLLLGIIGGYVDAGISLFVGLIATFKFTLIGAGLLHLAVMELRRLRAR